MSSRPSTSNATPNFEIFLATTPGLEALLAAEVSHKGFKRPSLVPGGVVLQGSWAEVWRANLWLRGTSKVLARLATFRAENLSQLASRSAQVPWAAVLRPDVPFRVEATCRKSRIYHSGAAVARIAHAITSSIGAPHQPDAALTIMARLEHDQCTLSIDTSGELLHKRGYKVAVNQAPLRENLAALLLQACGYDGQEPVYDPMCGSGTLVLEAAEIAARLNPGRQRTFAFEQLATFDDAAWQKMRAVTRPHTPAAHYFGTDRDAKAVAMSTENAARAGVAAITHFAQRNVSEIVPPCAGPGLVIINPPYGVRLGDAKKLVPLYRTLGQRLREHFGGWRVGLITPNVQLAKATGLTFDTTHPLANLPIPHGGLKVKLHCFGNK